MTAIAFPEVGGRGTGRAGPPAARDLPALRAAAPLRRVTNTCYLLAVIAINFTLFRPSPVDVLFVLALAMSLLSGQTITRNVFIFVSLILTWILSLYLSSLSLVANPEVAYYLVKISFAVSIGLCSALVAAHWTRDDLRRALKTFVLATVAAALIGSAGFLFGIDDLIWDGRAKAFLDDPNMFGAFLLLGLISCMYLLSEGGRRRVYGPALACIGMGLLLSFSRAAIMSGLVWGGVYFAYLNRRNLGRAGGYAAIATIVLALAVLVLSLTVDGLAEKLADRSTVAKDYDLGEGGRYNRYVLAIPFILDNPLGLGLLELERYFEEPIHNIWVSSFLNYGWLAGFAFTLLLIFTVAICASNLRRSRDPIFMAVTLAWIAVISCAFLHEAERWRHLWLITGLVWGVSVRRIAARPARGV